MWVELWLFFVSVSQGSGVVGFHRVLPNSRAFLGIDTRMKQNPLLLVRYLSRQLDGSA